VASPRPQIRLSLLRQPASFSATLIAVAPNDRVEQAGKVIHRLIVAASCDAAQETPADRRSTQTLPASAFLDGDGDVLIPPCQVIIVQFERLDRHNQQAGMN
jgi:hypothetical protein